MMGRLPRAADWRPLARPSRLRRSRHDAAKPVRLRPGPRRREPLRWRRRRRVVRSAPPPKNADESQLCRVTPRATNESEAYCCVCSAVRREVTLAFHALKACSSCSGIEER